MMEVEVERHERITAPLQLVWEEVDSLDQILAKSPHAFAYDVVPGGQRATGKGRLAWGPLKWTLDLDISLAEFRPRQHLVYVIDVSTFELHFDGTIDLSAVGDAETRLDYRGHLECHHRLANRMRGAFNEIVEEHAHGLLHRTKVRAEQRRLAQDRLLS
jgi:carbon monoxide dehydrogenase subunit G